MATRSSAASMEGDDLRPTQEANCAMSQTATSQIATFQKATSQKTVVSLTTGLEDAERVTVAFLVAVGAAETGRETLMFLTQEAVRLALPGTATGVGCSGCPSLESLVERYQAAGGRIFVCPICVDARSIDASELIAGAELNGTVPMWNWIGDQDATTFSY
jgi:predicted peroxiredoxin